MINKASRFLRFDSDLRSRLMTQAPAWCMGLLVLLLGLRMFALFPLPGGHVGLVTMPPSGASGLDFVNVPAILRANLFGQRPQSSEPAVTSAALLLAGVFADRDEKSGFAMIGTSSSDVKFYKVGATLPGGAELYSVFVDRVLLNRGGNIEALLIPPRVGSGAAATGAIVAVAEASQTAQRPEDFVRSNPDAIAQVVQRQVAFGRGKFRGMRVSPGANGEAFDRAGLRSGDLIVAINGVALKNSSQGNDLFNTLGTSASAQVTVERDGAQQSLVLNLAQVTTEAERLMREQAQQQMLAAAVPDESLQVRPRSAPRNRF